MCLVHIESFMLRSGVLDILRVVQLRHLICYYCCYNILSLSGVHDSHMYPDGCTVSRHFPTASASPLVYCMDSSCKYV